MVPRAGIEPAWCRHRQILSLLRLPFRHPGTGNAEKYTEKPTDVQERISVFVLWKVSFGNVPSIPQIRTLLADVRSSDTLTVPVPPFLVFRSPFFLI